MKNRLIILCITLAVTAIVCFALFSVSAAEVSPEVNQNPSSDKEISFTLAAWGNNIALFDSGEVIEVYDDIILSNLPPLDQTTLSEGIEITSFEQLATLLEDYDG